MLKTFVVYKFLFPPLLAQSADNLKGKIKRIKFIYKTNYLVDSAFNVARLAALDAWQ